MLALLVDWFASSLVVIVIVGPARFFADQSTSPDTLPSLLTLVVFVVETTVLTALSGGSFGKLATRLRVVRVPDGGRIDLLRSFARAILVALVIPPLIFRPDRRGLHDLAAGSATVPLVVTSDRG